MQPNYNQRTVGGMNLKLIILVILVVLLAFVAFLGYKASVFHIVSTDPKMSAVGAASPYIRVRFNDALQASSLDISDDQKILSSHTISGKTLTLNFKSGLTVGHRYVIVINHIENKQGEAIDSKVFSFIAKDIKFDNLSPEAQKESIARQDQYQYSVYSIPFYNFDKLLDNGLSSDQLFAVQQAIYDFSKIQKTEFKDVTLNEKTIMPGAFDPNGSDPTRNINFNMTANGKGYRVVVLYADLSNADTVIYDSQGRQVFSYDKNNTDLPE